MVKCGLAGLQGLSQHRGRSAENRALFACNVFAMFDVRLFVKTYYNIYIDISEYFDTQPSDCDDWRLAPSDVIFRQSQSVLYGNSIIWIERRE